MSTNYTLTLSHWHKVAERLSREYTDSIHKSKRVFNHTSIDAYLGESQERDLRERKELWKARFERALRLQDSIANIRAALGEANARVGITARLAEYGKLNRRQKALVEIVEADFSDGSCAITTRLTRVLLLVACCLSRFRIPESHRRGCQWLIPYCSPLPRFLCLRSNRTMRRTSKRWLQCLFTINEYRSFDIEAVNESFSRVTLDGVACRLRASPDTRAALQRGHVVRGRVVSIPGLPDDPSSRPWWVDEWQWSARERRRSDSLVCIDADTPDSHPDGDLFKAFIRRNPPGTAIEASVVAEREHSVELLLPEGIPAYVPIRRRGKATLRTLGCGWWRLPLPARLECLVTGYEMEHRLIFMVSFHPINYPGYCNAVAGYRSRFNHWTVPLRDRLEGRPRFFAQ